MQFTMDRVEFSYDGEPHIRNFKQIATIYEPNLSYELRELGVFLHEPAGKIWWAETSGCSCPSPYEEFWIDSGTLNSNMNILVPETLLEFEGVVMNFCKENDNSTDRFCGGPVSPEEKQKMLQIVRDHLEGK